MTQKKGLATVTGNQMMVLTAIVLSAAQTATGRDVVDNFIFSSAVETPELETAARNAVLLSLTRKNFVKIGTALEGEGAMPTMAITEAGYAAYEAGLKAAEESAQVETKDVSLVQARKPKPGDRMLVNGDKEARVVKRFDGAAGLVHFEDGSNTPLSTTTLRYEGDPAPKAAKGGSKKATGGKKADGDGKTPKAAKGGKKADDKAGAKGKGGKKADGDGKAEKAPKAIDPESAAGQVLALVKKRTEKNPIKRTDLPGLKCKQVAISLAKRGLISVAYDDKKRAAYYAAPKPEAKQAQAGA